MTGDSTMSGEEWEVVACVLQIAATQGMPPRGSVLTEGLYRRLSVYDEKTIRTALQFIDDEYEWATLDEPHLTVDVEKALDEATRLRDQAYE